MQMKGDWTQATQNCYLDMVLALRHGKCWGGQELECERLREWVYSALKTENLDGAKVFSDVHRHKFIEVGNSTIQHMNRFQFIFETYGCSKSEQVTQRS